MSSLTSAVPYAGEAKLELADASGRYQLQASVLRVEMKVPIVSWFIDIIMTYKVAAGPTGRFVAESVVASPPTEDQLVNWSLSRLRP